MSEHAKTPEQLRADEPPTEGKRTYAIVVCLFASLGGLFFGYDQGVTSAVLVMEGFINDFCIGYGGNTDEECHYSASKLPTNWIDFQLYYNLIYNCGCVVGSILGGFVADKFGRRATIFQAGVLFCVGTFWLGFNPAHEHASLLCSRFVAGLGVGNSSFSLPLFGSEMAPKELRGVLSGFMQMTVVTGILLANGINEGVHEIDIGWRITNLVACLPPIVVLAGIWFVPESPRWVYKYKGREQALATLQKVRQTENVHFELDVIGQQIEDEENTASWKELLEPSILKRVVIAMGLQVLQQATGINPMFTYGGVIFKDVVGDGVLSVLIVSIVNFVSTIPAMYMVDQVGRRKLLLIGGVGMIIGHLIGAITFTVGCDGDVDDAGCGTAPGIIILVGTAFFIFNFAISWGPVCWIYPAEIFPYHVRAKAVSLSTMSNWIMGIVMTWVVKLFPHININGVFFLFAALCLCCLTFVYFFCPETMGVMLEDIEALFSSGKKPYGNSPKYVNAETPGQTA